MQFDGWAIDRVSGDIARNGKSSRLAQQPLRILIELFDHAGAVVTREQLVKALWPAGIVDFDNGLNVAMRKLRVALDDVGDVPRYIETLPRVGYRFIGRRAGAPPAPAPRLKPSARIAIALSAVAVAAAVGTAWWLGSPEPEAPALATPAAKPRHVPSVRAHELYLEGLHQRSRRDVNGNPTALEKFEAAVREDPGYAAAWAALGETLSGSVVRQMVPPGETVEKARAAALRAIELDPALVDGHNLLGQIYMDHDKDFTRAKQEYDRSRSINDKSARFWHHYGMWLGQVGRTDDALAALRRARELEPMTLLYSANYALLLYQTRRYEEAVAFLQPLVAANERFDQARSVLARALMATGDLQGALTHMRARIDPGNYRADLGVLYARLGKRAGAQRMLDELSTREVQGFRESYGKALIHTAIGDLDRGCEYLLKAAGDGSLLVNWMRLEPWLDPLRGRQCYADAEKKLFGDVR
jgi:DNA-binding winged helix-turn-helix (wHTH) protein/Tfp pilus assembly protein PilF